MEAAAGHGDVVASRSRRLGTRVDVEALPRRAREWHSDMTRIAARYMPRPGSDGREPFVLVAYAGTADEMRFSFSEQLEIGRDDGRPDAMGVLLIRDPVVSRRHCVLSRRVDGRCFIRDLSLNGTRVDGRRLMPNVEVELRTGQTVAV